MTVVYFFATMMSENNYYFKHTKKYDAESGLYEVDLSGRLNETSYIRFIKEKEDLKTIFVPFKTLHIGSYDPFYLDDYEGSCQHYIFIGQK